MAQAPLLQTKFEVMIRGGDAVVVVVVVVAAVVLVVVACPPEAATAPGAVENTRGNASTPTTTAPAPTKLLALTFRSI
jgi:hypothetical protein